jgi:hypothetical protein
MDSMIGKIARKNNGQGNPSPAEIAEQQQNTAPPGQAAAQAVAEAAVQPLGERPAETTEAPATSSEEPAAPAEQAQTAVMEITADDPEGEVVLRARDPQTGQFSEMDQTRTYELSIRDKQTGETKVYNKTLPDLMRMAKDGVSMQKSRDELFQLRQAVPQLQQQTQTVAQEAEGFKALALQLLSADESTVVALREQYAGEQTPEKKLARLEAQMAQQRQQSEQVMQQQRIQAQVQQMGALTAPHIAEVEGLVGKELVSGKILLDTIPWMVNGKLPPERFGDFVQYVQGPLKTWAKEQAQQRTKAQAEAQQQTEAARQQQARAQQAVNQTGRQIQPVGQVGRDDAPKTRPKNYRDALESIIRKPVPHGA